MAARSRDIAQEWVDEINAATWVETFTAVRKYHVIWDLAEDLSDLLVSVRYAAVEPEPQTRSGDKELHTIQIGVQKRTPDQALATLDALADQTEAIYRWTKRKRFDLGSGGTFAQTNSTTEYLEEYQRLLNQFAAIVTVQVTTSGD